MVRQARIDYPGAFHHIMVRGIARCKLFTDNKDRQEFLDRLAMVLTDSGTPCLAFALMPTHFHLLLITGSESISTVMSSLLIRYAAYYNRRHNSNGKLYQNRFKSILCDKEEYLLTLTRYIHLNPVRGGVLKSVRTLDTDPWTSHASYIGDNPYSWLQTEEVLQRFGRRLTTARKKYHEYITAGREGDKLLNSEKSGLSRTFKGEWSIAKARDREMEDKCIERIMGSGDFLTSVLTQAKEQETQSSKLQREGWDFERVLDYVAQTVGLDDPRDIFVRGYGGIHSQGRALFCKWLADDLKVKQTEIAAHLGMSPAPVSRLVKQGRILEKKLGVKLGS
jgi:putative transposase